MLPSKVANECEEPLGSDYGVAIQRWTGLERTPTSDGFCSYFPSRHQPTSPRCHGDQYVEDDQHNQLKLQATAA